MPSAWCQVRPLPAFLLYSALTVLLTWPLAAGIGRDVPGDLGDSLLVMWILGWGAEGLPRVLTGAMSVRDVWNANIFHPEPLALGFSEHLFAQVLQILPVYHLTGNLILCYNLLFLSTFALSGLGMYLLVRDITDNELAGFFAGLVYAFVPFRVAELTHLQVLSSQWMPFALYGFRRFIYSFPRQRPTLSAHNLTPLAGGTAALLMQNWSCGYYLVYFAPFVPLFIAHQMLVNGRLRDARLWLAFIGAGIVTAIGTWPFLALYAETRQVHGLTRPIEEVALFAGDLYGYATAHEMMRLWGAVLRAATKPGSEMFLGMTATVVALIGVGRAIYEAREGTARLATQTVWFALVATILAMWLALGPRPTAGGQPLHIVSLYSVLYNNVPGFDGLRVPVRYAMIAALFLAITAGIGAASIARLRRFGLAAVCAASVLVVVESTAAPIPINETWGGAVKPPNRVYRADAAPAVYRFLATLPTDAVIAEVPFGHAAWELRYVYYSTAHWRRIINGYSGGFPHGYLVRREQLERLPENNEAAWHALQESQTTHVVVHERAFLPGYAHLIAPWLAGHGAHRIAQFDGDAVWALPVN